jgi:deoxyribodipyrimidine photolyase-related protein
VSQSAPALRLVLGDQLSLGLSSLADATPADLILMAEVREEATYVRHHKQKIALTFAAMRSFAAGLEGRGLRVRYVRIDDPASSGAIAGELERALAEAGPFGQVIVTECGEWRLQSALQAFAARCAVPVEIRDDSRFLCSHAGFEAWARDRKELRMEWFYREMRRRTGLLMDGDQPADGRWNFDAENRRRLPPGLRAPRRKRFEPDAVAREAIADVERLFPDHFGTLDAFGWPTTAAQAQLALDHFLRDALPLFGDWQDAMATGEPFLWHSLVSTAINLGLLDPLEVCRRAEAEWRAGRAPLNAVEGFVRQILGWREFVRGVYWLKMPEYGRRNALEADRALPSLFWSGETDMVCVRETVIAARDHAYAHHIQRLMVTGNLMMLLGVHPDAVDDWYMTVFADAYEWVEMPNTRGMATFADGGIVGSKPYAASGAYIKRMSDHCGGCRYDPAARTVEGACPFNALYWDFLIANEPRLGGNARMAMPYRNLARFSDAERAAITTSAEAVRQRMGAVAAPC